MLPGTVRVRYGEFAPNPPNLLENKHRVRPTSGLEFVSSRHFPEEVQGDVLIHNTIGFLGTKQHTLEDEGTGYKSRHRHDLLVCSDPNFRPVDMEFAPDGSLYLLDWHNVLIGHAQHSARDPLRDHVHGRVYRITYPSRPLVKPTKVEGAAIQELLDNLLLPEYRTRYRTRRELRGRPADQVLAAPPVMDFQPRRERSPPRAPPPRGAVGQLGIWIESISRSSGVSSRAKTIACARPPCAFFGTPVIKSQTRPSS